MQQVTVFLRTPLFSFREPENHVPVGTLGLKGTILEKGSGLLTLQVAQLMDDRGKVLKDVEMVLDLPMAKVDHILRVS